FFFFNSTPATEIYTLSLHDALPIYVLFSAAVADNDAVATVFVEIRDTSGALLANLTMTFNSGSGAYEVSHAFPTVGTLSYRIWADRKSTRLNSSHDQISYAVFCLKK